jgi:hypothetical protein
VECCKWRWLTHLWGQPPELLLSLAQNQPENSRARAASKTNPLCHLFERGVDAAPVPHVHRQRQRAAAQLLDFGCERLGLGQALLDVGQHHVGAGPVGGGFKRGERFGFAGAVVRLRRGGAACARAAT